MPGSTPTLRDMIQEAAKPRGPMTYEQLAKRAQDSGENISGAYLNKIALNKVSRPPTAAHVRAIAAALGQPYERVRQAAIRQWWPADAAEPNPDALIQEARRIAAEAARFADAVERGSAAGERPADRESA